MRGADALVRALAAAGVRRIFSLSGNQIMPVYDACIDAGVDIVHTRHEAAAVFMAEAWAQLTGQVGVALVTAGPGFANALGPLVSARASETPVLLISGDAPAGMDGRGAFQELDQAAIAAPLVKATFRPRHADDLARQALSALEVAAGGRPGPVHLAVPFDVVNAATDALPAPAAAPAGPAPDMAAVADLLAGADRPLILTGPALSPTRAPGLAQRLRAACGAPVVTLESPRGLRDPSLGALTRCLPRADLVLCLGKAVDFSLGFGAAGPWDAACRWVVVDAEEPARARAARNLGDRLALAMEAVPAAAAEALTGVARGPARADWCAEVEAALDRRPEADRAEDPGAITSESLCAAVQRRVRDAPDAVVICDGGEFGQWAQALVRGAARIVNGPSGAIGGSLCYAIAAAQARPGTLVVALMGDGTAGFHLAEFETAARSGTAFVAVIGNDARWNAEHLIQLRDYGADRTMGCTLSGARYDLAAQALGCHGEYVTDPAALDAALARAIASGLPACVNVRIEGLAAPAGAAG